jgi:hypothetical protein
VVVDEVAAVVGDGTATGGGGTAAGDGGAGRTEGERRGTEWGGRLLTEAVGDDQLLSDDHLHKAHLVQQLLELQL